MVKDLVTVIIPAYNAEQYVSACLDSVINQTYENIEIIIVNDGSIDSTPHILEEYERKYSSICVFHKVNEGVSVARNIGLRHAKGEYITFVDADDIVSSSFVSEGVAVLSQLHADIALGNTVYWRHNTLPDNELVLNDSVLDRTVLIKDMSLYRKKVLGNGKEKDNPLNGVFTSGPVCKLFRASVLEGHLFPKDLKIGEDTVFNLDIIDDTKAVAYVQSNWYYYRINSDSATQSYNPEVINNASKLIEHLQLMNRINDSDYYPYLLERAIQQFRGLLLSYVMHPDNKIRTKQRIKLINSILKNSPWNTIFRRRISRPLPGTIYDKVMLQLCVHKASTCIYVLVKAREYLLNARNKSK